MPGAKLAFSAVVIIVTASLVFLINVLPTVFDLITVAAATIGGVLIGRKSTWWF